MCEMGCRILHRYGRVVEWVVCAIYASVFISFTGDQSRFTFSSEKRIRRFTSAICARYPEIEPVTSVTAVTQFAQKVPDSIPDVGSPEKPRASMLPLGHSMSS